MNATFRNSLARLVTAAHDITAAVARLRPTPKEVALKSNVGIWQKHCQTLDQRHL